MRNKKMQLETIISVLAVVLIALIVVIFLIKVAHKVPLVENSTTATTDEVVNTEEHGIKETAANDESSSGECFLIDTPFCELVYPIKWRNSIRIEVIEEQEAYALVFYGKAGKIQEKPLFKIIFGESSAHQIGVLEHSQGSVPVCVEFYDITYEENATVEEKMEITGMCEDVNVIIEGLQESGAFATLYYNRENASGEN